MFTLEIDGKAVAITDAEEERARDLFDSQDFKDDLLAMESEGRPLWDGATALLVRAASEDEIDAFDEILSEDDEDGAEADTTEAAADDDEDDEDGDGINVLFLVPVDDEDETPPN